VTSSNPATRLVLVDDEESPPPGRCVAAWRAHRVPAGVVSIPAEVERCAEELRDEYVRWIGQLGETEIRGRSIRSHLQLWPDFSFWWMTLLAEKASFKTAAIYVVFKLRALERVYRDRACQGVLYAGDDPVAERVLRQWCHSLGEPFEYVRRGRATRDNTGRPRLSDRLPHVVRALGYLAWRWRSAYRIARRVEADPIAGAATMVTWVPNIDLDRARQGRFWSRYWEDLHDVLDTLQVRVNWLCLYVDSGQASLGETVDLLGACNERKPDKYQYCLLEQFASPRVIAGAFTIWLKVCLRRVTLRPARAAFHMPGSTLNFFPALADDWHSSLCGIAAIDGALLVALFEEAAKRFAPSPWALYVWENQAWEHAAIAAWRKHGVRRIVGVQHATLPPLDLRPFVDPRERSASDGSARPTPDRIAVNGSGARELLARAGFPPEQLFETEALRYGHLMNARQRRAAAESILLVVTGYLGEEVARQFAVLNEAASAGALDGWRVVIKAHPMCPIDAILRRLPLRFPHELTDEPLTALWVDARAAFTSNSTSAALEGLQRGVPTAICGPGDGLNLSPAFGRSVPMVSTADDLVRFLKEPRTVEWPRDYFVLDRGLPRWRALLATLPA